MGFGEKDLAKLVASLNPQLSSEEYVFCTVEGEYSSHAYLNPLASFREEEGLSLIIAKGIALENDIEFDSIFKCITLRVHSSLDAVGLTALVSQKLAEHQISANVVAAFHHDHIFVGAEKAPAALQLLRELRLT